LKRRRNSLTAPSDLVSSGLQSGKIHDRRSWILPGIGGINMISGAGMLNFESTQSIQKLVIDNEICSMTYRFL
jgi:trimethylamine--corrinoid protein Co-methyltransferase